MHPRRSSKWLFYITLIASLTLLPGAVGKDRSDNGKDGSARFRGLDRNNDGRITRDEWRGNDRSFSVHDRNGDGVLAGAEVGAALQAEGYDDFLDIDRNRDGRISRNEWHWNQADFDRIDDNHDGWLTRSEYMDTSGDALDSHFPDSRQGSPGTLTNVATPLPEDRGARFSQLDRNGNGLISHDEWDGDRKSFNFLDDNRNGALSREEFVNVSPAVRRALFKGFDLNGNGAISRTEWNGDRQSFARLDANDDGKLMRDEFVRRYDNLEQTFSGMDRDHNGRLSRQEWRGDRQAFGYLDDNHDDQISLAEFVGVN
ncbi:MAG TPA: hypothetical protein VGK94_01605 [Candidatus Polarisedimenticolia bacterium]|jgi:Ca2+-binding EF-hand superfamily protein